jgi:GT2 family glycosyltransferase/2-polyprenyl-3-methyl-5-hydroxy-6-metoxy-1,4-benzoquinol methylase
VPPEDLAVVIPTRARWPILKRTLAALDRQTVKGFETIVVLDGLGQNPPDLGTARVIAQEHAGPGAARNRGAAATDRRLVLFLGDDMVPDPDLIELHLQRHEREPEPHVAVLGLAVWHPDVAAEPLQRWLDWSGLQFDYHTINGSDAGWPRFYSCNVSLKRDFFLAAGGFDEDFVYYYEDLDAGYRLGQHDMELRFEPAAITRHWHRYDWPGIERRFAGIARGEWLMAQKHQWFKPWFRPQLLGAASQPRVRAPWQRAVPLLPAGETRSKVERRVTTGYLQRLEPLFTEAWDGERDLSELKEYLGDRFDVERLRHHVDEVEREEEAAPDETTFYRTSEAYLYDLTVFARSGTKVPYRQALRNAVPPGARLLDYGCGIGSDGLRLIEAGYHVDFADFANPSTAYLRWRLEQRGLSAQIFDVEGHVPGGYDAVYCFDVIEHIEDPFAFLAELESHARLVAVNFLEPSPDDTHVHHDLPVRELLAHATKRGLVHYRRYYERSHLVIYRSGNPGPTKALRSGLTRTLGDPRVRGLGKRLRHLRG